MTTGELNVGVIGAGRIGRLHADHLSRRVPRANLVMVADVVHDAATQCARETGANRASTDYREVLDDPKFQDYTLQKYVNEKKFSKATISSFRLSKIEIKNAYSKVSKTELAALRLAKARLEKTESAIKSLFQINVRKKYLRR